MPGKSTKKSNAYKLLELVFQHNREGTGHSWQRMNASLNDAVKLAISAGFTFAKDDFASIYADFRGSHWFGDDLGERWYGDAIAVDLVSACQSYESFRDRPPFIHEGKRLHVGSEFQWEGVKVKLTSFGTDGVDHFITAVSYKPRSTDPAERYDGFKIDKRFRITVEEIRKGERERTRPVPLTECETFIKREHGRGLDSCVIDYLKQHQTLRSAWEAADNVQEMLRAAKKLGWSKLVILPDACTPDQLRAAVDWDVELAPLVEAMMKGKRKDKVVA